MAQGDIIKDADLPGLGEQETLPGGAVSVGDAIPEMPPGSDMNDVAAPGGGLTADDTAQPTTTGRHDRRPGHGPDGAAGLTKERPGGNTSGPFLQRVTAGPRRR